jgi:Sec-independent protein translocase protein TatA
MTQMVLFLGDVAGSEVLLILVFILIFFGSKSIPGIARTFGRTIRQIKDASQDLQDEIKKSTGDIKGDLNLSGLIRDTVQEKTQDLQAPFEEFASDLDESIKFEQKNNYFINKQMEEANRGTTSPSPIANTNQEVPKEEDKSSSIPLDQQHLD